MSLFDRLVERAEGGHRVLRPARDPFAGQGTAGLDADEPDLDEDWQEPMDSIQHHDEHRRQAGPVIVPTPKAHTQSSNTERPASVDGDSLHETKVLLIHEPVAERTEESSHEVVRPVLAPQNESAIQQQSPIGRTPDRAGSGTADDHGTEPSYRAPNPSRPSDEIAPPADRFDDGVDIEERLEIHIGRIELVRAPDKPAPPVVQKVPRSPADRIPLETFDGAGR